MNSKRLLSAIAAGVIATTTVIPSTTFAAAYTEEYQNAYAWAKENGITNASKIYNYDNAGTATSCRWWLRTPYCYITSIAYSVSTDGGFDNGGVGNTYAVRAAFQLEL